VLPPHDDDVRVTVLGAAATGADSVPDALGARIWDVAIAVGELDDRRMAVLGGCAPRLLAVPELTSETLRRASELAAEPVDDASLRSRWAALARLRERTGLLAEPRPGTRARVLALLERHTPRVATRIRELIP
jgi:hypothetical protein